MLLPGTSGYPEMFQVYSGSIKSYHRISEFLENLSFPFMSHRETSIGEDTGSSHLTSRRGY